MAQTVSVCIPSLQWNHLSWFYKFCRQREQVEDSLQNTLTCFPLFDLNVQVIVFICNQDIANTICWKAAIINIINYTCASYTSLTFVEDLSTWHLLAVGSNVAQTKADPHVSCGFGDTDNEGLKTTQKLYQFLEWLCFVFIYEYKVRRTAHFHSRHFQFSYLLRLIITAFFKCSNCDREFLW